MHKIKSGGNLIFIAIIILVAYLPVSTFLFAVKNDFFTGYFSPKFFLSESLNEGIIPLWNPYINYGIPAYGDMSSAFWNPPGWLIAFTIGYNAYTFTIELLIYLLIAGWGMFRLSAHFGLHQQATVLAAISYACCGYFTGNLQHFNWITGAALLPWCMVTFLRYMSTPNRRNLAGTLLCFFLFLTAAHPGLMIGAFYFFMLISAAWFHTSPVKKPYSNKTKFIPLFILIACILLIHAGMFYAYADTIPEITRAEIPTENAAANGATTLQSLISLLLPLATVKESEFFATDISMRNIYPGLFILTLIFCGLLSRKTVWQKWLLATGLFFLVLSAGNIAGFSLKKMLPLTGYVRLEGEFRIFTLLAMILFGAMVADQILKNRSADLWVKTIKTFCYLLLSAAVISVIYKLSTGTGVFFTNHDYYASTLTTKVKSVLEDLSMADCIILQSGIQLGFLLFFLWMFNRKPVFFRIWVFATELILAVLLQLPFTGVGTKSVRDIQQLISYSPKGIPVPSMNPTSELVSQYPQTDSTIGNWSMYSKEIAVGKLVPYPIVLKTTDTLFQSSAFINRLGKSFAYLEPDTGLLIPDEFFPGRIVFTTESPQIANLSVKQNTYKYWKVQIDSSTMPVESVNGFLSTMIPAGKHKVTFSFDTKVVKILLLLHALLFLSLLAFSILTGRKETLVS